MTKPRAKLRPMGDVLLDLETILEELVDAHQLQFGDVLALVWSWLCIHRPGAREFYISDGSSPEFTYGPRKDET